MSRITTTALRTNQLVLLGGLPMAVHAVLGALPHESREITCIFTFNTMRAPTGNASLWAPTTSLGRRRALPCFEARDKSAALSTLYRNGVKDLHAHPELPTG